jgi:hypothetical protein
VSPDRDLSLSPAETDIGMVALLFRKFADTIYKRQRFAKVFESITLFQVMVVHNFPSVQLRKQFRNLFTLKGRHTTATRYTFPG